ncbi:hypothetical protein AMTRI_Chr01g109580 [Amborella trichopoda]
MSQHLVVTSKLNLNLALAQPRCLDECYECMRLTGAPGWCVRLAESSSGLFGRLNGASREVCYPCH